jgi:hypothetical protein
VRDLKYRRSRLIPVLPRWIVSIAPVLLYGLWIIFFPNETAMAASGCPNNYFQIQTQSALVDVQSSIKYTVCIFSHSSKNNLDVKARVSLAATNAKVLSPALLTIINPTQDCSGFWAGLISTWSPTGSGWQINAVTLNFHRTGGQSYVELNGATRCTNLGTFAYKVPLDYAISNGVLALSIDQKQARVEPTGLAHTIPNELRDQVTSSINFYIGPLNYALSNLVPKFVGDLDPVIDSVVLTINQNAVELDIVGAAQLTAANGEALLSAGTSDLSVKQLLQLLKGLSSSGV